MKWIASRLFPKLLGQDGSSQTLSIPRLPATPAVAQFTRGLDQIAKLPSTLALRREQIKLQIALITPLMHLKGYAAPETQTAAERARVLIEQAEGPGDPPEDPLLLFSVLYGFWVANYIAFSGDVMRELVAQFLALAKRREAKIPLMMGHRLMGVSLASTGDLAQGLTHLDRAMAIHEPAEYRPLATRFGQDVGAAMLSYRSWAL